MYNISQDVNYSVKSLLPMSEFFFWWRYLTLFEKPQDETGFPVVHYIVKCVAGLGSFVRLLVVLWSGRSSIRQLNGMYKLEQWSALLVFALTICLSYQSTGLCTLWLITNKSIPDVPPQQSFVLDPWYCHNDFHWYINTL